VVLCRCLLRCDRQKLCERMPCSLSWHAWVLGLERPCSLVPVWFSTVPVWLMLRSIWVQDGCEKCKADENND